MQGPAGDVDGEIDDRDVVLQQVPGEPADDAAQQHDQRQLVVVQMERIGQLLDGERRVGIQLAIAFFACGARGRHQGGGSFELGHQSVDRLDQLSTSSSTLAAGSSVRTSKMEIIGRRRMKRKNRNRNRPMVPM